MAGQDFSPQCVLLYPALIKLPLLENERPPNTVLYNGSKSKWDLGKEQKTAQVQRERRGKVYPWKPL